MGKNGDVIGDIPIEKVDFPKSGGTFSYLKGHKYPWPGFPHGGVVREMDFVKRLVPVLINAYYPLVKRRLIKPERYSRPVREIYRASEVFLKRVKGEGLREKLTKVRDMICMFLEFDNVYRWVLQALAEEIDWEKVKPDKADRYWMAIYRPIDFCGKKTKRKKQS